MVQWVIKGYILACHLYSLSTKASYRQISRSLEIGCYKDCIPLKFDGHLGNAVAEVPVKYESDLKSLNPILAASRRHEIVR